MTLTHVNADPKYKGKLIEILSSAEIPERWQKTPIESFILHQNLGYPLQPGETPQILIVSCMEFRYSLPIPPNYAYVIRTPGGRLLGEELALGYVFSRGVKDVLLMAHNDCGMTKLQEHAGKIAETYVEHGWDRGRAEMFTRIQIAKQVVKDELEALQSEYIRLKSIFLNINIAPLFLNLSDRRVLVPSWYMDMTAAGAFIEQEKLSDSDLDKLFM